MNLPNRQIKKPIGLVGVIFGSLIFAFPAVAQMSPTMRENMNQMPENEELSPIERSRMCAEHINSTVRGQNIPSTLSQGISPQSTNQPASIIQTLPSGRVSEPPAVRDGRFPAPSEAQVEKICSNEIMEQNSLVLLDR